MSFVYAGQAAVDALVTKIKENTTAIENITADNTVTVEHTTGALDYTIKQGGVTIGTINIPKDMVVSNGSVETYTSSNLPSGVSKAGTYLVLTLANADEDTLYIDVSTLIEYVTSGSSTGDMVVITIDSNHKVTAEITDGTITKTKLVSEIVTSLEKADTALQDGDVSVITTSEVDALFV